MTSLRVPSATYRIQFNRIFHFADARALVPYLRLLGITDLYASPIFQARRGSTHGYDVTDPTRLNPELGPKEDFDLLVKELKRHRMGLLLDIVPNHMAASPENPWWADVLANGASSPYARYFDIDWRPATFPVKDKVLLPVLGAPYGHALENRELILGLDETGFFVRYFEVRLPLHPKSYRRILAHRISTLEQTLGVAHPALRALADLIAAIQALPGSASDDPQEVKNIPQDRQALQQQLWDLYRRHAEIKAFLDGNIKIFNGRKGSPHSFDLLDELLGDQAYRLAHWRAGRMHLNYRRFFDINDLVSMRVEDPHVFEATHALIVELVNQQKVTGLRADHIDGLYDPGGYFRNLQDRIAAKAAHDRFPGFYLLAEKILIGDETLPAEWPVHGTTGYEFATAVNGVFVDPRGMRALDTVYTGFTGAKGTFRDVVYDRKKQVMKELFMGEVSSLGHHLDELAEQHRHARDVTPQARLQALVEVTACLPVYRTYIRDAIVPAHDRPFIEQALREAERRNPAPGPEAFDFLRRVLLLDFSPPLPEQQKAAWLYFVMRWQQFTGPIMAKGLEDTSLYVYNRLISLNEVGGDPAAERQSVEGFHRHNLGTRARWPYTMNATSTHDTKRSEDVRARINVLSEIPEAWAKCLSRWSRWNRAKKRRVDGTPVPDPNEEIFLYQTLLGAWPLRKDAMPEFKERLKAYVIKAAKEAKVHTSWIDPNPDYEHALAGFVDAILKPSRQNRFFADILRFQRRIAFWGAFNALAQALLKIASPGVPDSYQGTELWDFSLVDPDNRRPVDFTKRLRFLQDLKRRETNGLVPLISELLANWEDGRIKLFVTSKALHFRRDQSRLFVEGDYVPLHAAGKRKEHVCAFARQKEGAWALIAVPRLLTKLVPDGKPPLGKRVWGTDRLVLPGGAPQRWVNVFTGETMTVSPGAGKKVLPLKSVFQHCVVALLWGLRT